MTSPEGSSIVPLKIHRQRLSPRQTIVSQAMHRIERGIEWVVSMPGREFSAHSCGNLARIIRDFEDKRSLLCYKHGDYSLFGARPEASSCLTIAQHSVCCSLIFSASLSLPSLISEKVVPMAALCCSRPPIATMDWWRNSAPVCGTKDKPARSIIPCRISRTALLRGCGD